MKQIKRLYLLISVILALSSFSGFAQTALPSNFFTKKLQNGLQMLVIENHAVPIFTIEIAVKNGAYTEPHEFNGLSHLYEHMFFKANKTYPSQEAFLDRIKELGISFNGTTSEERVNYFFTTQKAYLPEGIDFMNSAIRYPLFLADEIKRENKVVDGEFQRQESSPVHFLFDTVGHLMWGSLYSRKNTIGDHQVILSATPEKMRVIKGKYYVPNNSLITVAGDVEHEKVFDLLEKTLGSWESSAEDPHKTYPEPEFKPLEKTTYTVIDKEIAKTPIMMFSWMGPSVSKDPESTYAADIFSGIIAQTGSSLQQKLVKTGLAFQVSMNYQTLDHVGPISLFVVPNPLKMKECLDTVKAELGRMDQDSYFSDEQLKTSKEQIKISDTYSKEQTSELVHEVSYFWCSGGFDYYAGYQNQVSLVKRSDIQTYIRRYIKDKFYVGALILSPDLRKMSGVDQIFKP